MRLKVVSTTRCEGAYSYPQTTVLDAETGRALEYVTSVSFRHDGKTDCARLVVEVADFDFEGEVDAEVIAATLTEKRVAPLDPRG